jgi:hypothetical protein
MFKNQSFPQGEEYDSHLKIFKNIMKSKFYKVAAHAKIFPCVEAISWIVQHVDLDTRYILNAKECPITSFQDQP